MGDVKLAGVMGLFLGLSIVPALLVAFLAGSVVGRRDHGARGRRRRARRRSRSASFLALGGIVGVLAGHELIDLYSDSFLA